MRITRTYLMNGSYGYLPDNIETYDSDLEAEASLGDLLERLRDEHVHTIENEEGDADGNCNCDFDIHFSREYGVPASTRLSSLYATRINRDQANPLWRNKIPPRVYYSKDAEIMVDILCNHRHGHGVEYASIVIESDNFQIIKERDSE